MSQCKVVVRQGQLKDMKEVLQLGGISGGVDYLSSRYETYCEDPGRINYILEVDGAVVAYIVATMVDEGEGVVFQAARTLPEHQQKGYQYQLKKAAIKELLTVHPNLKEVLYCPWAATGRTSDNKRIVITRNYFHFNLSTPAALQAVKGLEREHQETIQNIEFSKIGEYLDRDDFRKCFPGGRVLIEWVPYRLDVPSNFTLPNRFPDYFLISYADDGKIDGVSFHTVYGDKGEDYERHDVEIYCKQKEQCLNLAAFFLHNVIGHISCSKVPCMVIYPDCLDKVGMNAALEDTFGILDGEKFTNIPNIPLVVDLQYFK